MIKNKNGNNKNYNFSYNNNDNNNNNRTNNKNYNKIIANFIIVIVIIFSIIDIIECKSISINRRHKLINLYHPATDELIISSTINNNRYNSEHIHNLINHNNNHNHNHNLYNKNNKLLINNQDSSSNNNNDTINNNNNNKPKIYKFLKLKNNSDYNHNKTYYNLKKNKNKQYNNDNDIDSSLNVNNIINDNGSDNNNNNNNNNSSSSNGNNNIKTSSSILYGGITSSFEYFIPILVGTPPQMFTVQVDTGSTSLAVPGSNCYLYKSQAIKTSCSCSDGNLDGLYSLEESISSTELNCSDTENCNTCKSKSSKACPFVLKYGDGSFIAGSLVIDHVTIGGFTVPAKFGNIQKESLSFSQLTCPSTQRSQAVRDGILGLSYQQLDPDNGDDIFSKIVQHYNIPNVFSMCLGKDGGLLTIGGTNDHITQGTPNYTPIYDPHYYSITVLNIHVGSVSLNLAPSDLTSSIVDSGTTLLYFSDEIFYAIVRSLEDKYENLPGIANDPFWEGNCHHLEESIIQEYPTIFLEMKGLNGAPSFKLEVPPDLYLLNINGLYCFGISHMKEISVLIGDVVLQGYNVIYNRENASIGFARTNGCSPEGNDNASLMLSIESGNLQKSTEEERFNEPLVLKLLDTNKENAVSGVIVGFTVVSGVADFYPSHMSSIRNITDSNGIVSILVVPKLFGKIIIEATVWGNNNTNVIYFTLHSSMKPWKVILISISTIVCILVIISIGFLVYKKKLQMFNKSHKPLSLTNKSYYNNNNNNNDDDDYEDYEDGDEFNNNHLTINTDQLINNINDNNNNNNIDNNNSISINNNSINNNNINNINNNNNHNNNKQSEWSIFSSSLINGLDINDINNNNNNNNINNTNNNYSSNK